jgi:hypothetical protein
LGITNWLFSFKRATPTSLGSLIDFIIVIIVIHVIISCNIGIKLSILDT